MNLKVHIRNLYWSKEIFFCFHCAKEPGPPLAIFKHNNSVVIAICNVCVIKSQDEINVCISIFYPKCTLNCIPSHASRGDSVRTSLANVCKIWIRSSLKYSFEKTLKQIYIIWRRKTLITTSLIKIYFLKITKNLVLSEILIYGRPHIENIAIKMHHEGDSIIMH